MDGSPIEVTLAKPVDKDSYVRYTRGTGGRGGSLLQTDYTTYTLGQVQVQKFPKMFIFMVCWLIEYLEVVKVHFSV